MLQFLQEPKTITSRQRDTLYVIHQSIQHKALLYFANGELGIKGGGGY